MDAHGDRKGLLIKALMLWQKHTKYVRECRKYIVIDIAFWKLIYLRICKASPVQSNKQWLSSND